MNKKIVVLIFLGFLVAIISFFNTGIKRRIRVLLPDVFIKKYYISKPPNYIINDSIHYYKQKESFVELKKTFKKKYQLASKAEKQKILAETSQLLYSNLIDSLIPYWYGTPWDFNGISQKPGTGEIACGYFVFTLLRDAGMKIPRIKMSQAASEQTIKSLVPKKKIKRFSNLSLENFISKVQSMGNGLYIVGLDNHIGLLLVEEKETWFIHSTAYSPKSVIKEKALKSPALEYSSYRVVGKLSDNNFLTKKWLFSEFIKLK